MTSFEEIQFPSDISYGAVGDQFIPLILLQLFQGISNAIATGKMPEPSIM